LKLSTKSNNVDELKLVSLLQVVLGKPKLLCHEQRMKQVLPCQLPDCPDGIDPCSTQANPVQTESMFVESEELAATEGINHRPAVVWTTSPRTTFNLLETTSEIFDSIQSMSTFKNEARTESLLSIGQNKVTVKSTFENENERTSTAQIYESKGKKSLTHPKDT